jgi:cyclic pyranopterin phosphate synthase
MEKSSELNHLDAAGKPHMVDVGGKKATHRLAEAESKVVFPADAWEKVLSGDLPKGGIETPAKIAGIQAAKRTSEWIPLCHPLPLDSVNIEIQAIESCTLQVRCTARTTARTGVEMEAMVGAAAAALCLYDMTKALSKGIVLQEVRLLRKSGGKSGEWTAQ